MTTNTITLNIEINQDELFDQVQEALSNLADHITDYLIEENGICYKSDHKEEIYSQVLKMIDAAK